MIEGYYSGMSSIDLLALRIRQLEKRPEDMDRAADVLRKSRLTSKSQFEKRFAFRIKQETFQKGDLVLVRNTRIEKELNRKTKPRYLGPYEVVRQTQKGSYVVKELDGSVSRSGIAAFRLLKYFPATDNIADLVKDPISEISMRDEYYYDYDEEDVIEQSDDEILEEESD